MNYTTLYKSESSGTYGHFGIEIRVAGTALPDLNLPAIGSAAWDASDLVEAAVREAGIAADPEQKKRALLERAELTALFPGLIFVEQIPNGYCSRWCCRHLPWFVVTTAIGRFRVGWRKRVIHLEWTETVATKKAEELFPSDNVTKFDRIIHAWSLDDARRYVARVVESVVNPA